LVNDKRVERIWRREGLKVPGKQPKRGRLWLNDGSCVRLRAERRDHVWAYDFVEDRTHDGRKYRMLNIVDEFTHECLAIRIARRLKAVDVIDVLSDLFILRGVPGHIRSDNGPEFVAKAVRHWIAAVGAQTAYIEPSSPWENSYIESFNARQCGELQKGEIISYRRKTQIAIESQTGTSLPSGCTCRSATVRRRRMPSSRECGRGRPRTPATYRLRPHCRHRRRSTSILIGSPYGAGRYDIDSHPPDRKIS